MNRKSLLLLIALVAATLSHAQNNIGLGNSGFNPLKLNLPFEISPKGGLGLPSTGLKNTSFLDKGWMGGLDISLPILKSDKKNIKPLSFDLGLEAGLDYSSFTSNGGLAYVKSAYQLANNNLNPYFDNSSNKARALQFSAGPKISLSYKKIHLTPSLQFGYLSFQRNGYTILDTVRNAAGTQSTIPLLLAKENKTNGLLIRPKINLGFDITKYIRVWVGSSMSSGPVVNNEYFVWEPAKKALGGNGLTTDELVSGKPVSQTMSARFNSVTVEFGIKMGLGITPLSKPGIKFPQSIPPLKSIYKEGAIAGKILPVNNDAITKGIKGGLKNDNSITPGNSLSSEKTYPASAPGIVYPTAGSKTALVNNDLHLSIKESNTPNVNYILTIWTEKNGKRKNILQKSYPDGWDGTVKDLGNLIDKKSTITTYYAQIQATPGNSIYSDIAPSKKVPSDYHALQQSGKPVFDNEGKSAPVAFGIVTGCFPQLAVDLDSAKCVDSNKSKVWGHIILTNVTGVTVSNITITDFKENNFSGPAVPVSGLTPGTVLPPVNNSQFSFKVDKDMCGKILFMRVLITYTCALTGETVTVPCADTISMPCCKCNYCADSMKITSQNSGISYNNSSNNAQITQSFSVTPNNITNVTAEIVYMSDSVNDPACQVCDTKPASVYTFSGTNTISWNGNPVINASAANSSSSFPSKIISWTCNNNGDIDFNLSAGLPDIPKLDCCKRNVRICIRYSFTDTNCKKCDILVCYSLTYSNNGTDTNNGTGK